MSKTTETTDAANEAENAAASETTTPPDATAVQPTEQTGKPKGIWMRRATNALVVLVVASLCVGAIAGGIHALQVRASNDESLPANPAVTVRTSKIELQDTYRIGQSFVGRVEPTRETQLAFELAGTVLKVAVNEGGTVKAGDVIAELDTARLETRRQELAAQRKELEARLALSQATEKRQRALNKRGFAATQRLDEARFQSAELRASLTRLDANLAAVDVDLRKSTLRAPYAGRVSSRQIDEGAIVAAGTPVATVLENSRQQIRVGIARAASSKLRVGTSYPFKAGDRMFDAKLIALRPDLDVASRTVTALFETDRSGALPFGTVVTLEMSREIEEPGAWVPT
ncbi:MAG: efflux RND transporter periplasmic adaptor subunit, partial [Pseudomonadota bacterium]